jgi:hypothetical protein
LLSQLSQSDPELWLPLHLLSVVVPPAPLVAAVLLVVVVSFVPRLLAASL